MSVAVSKCLVLLTHVIVVGYQYAAYNWFPGYLPHMGGCAGTPTAGIVGGGIIFSYLLLFLDFFYETYLRKDGSHDFVTCVQRHSQPSAAAPEGLLFCVEKSRLDHRRRSGELTMMHDLATR